MSDSESVSDSLSISFKCKNMTEEQKFLFL
jgi:hypothetical protein